MVKHSTVAHHGLRTRIQGDCHQLEAHVHKARATRSAPYMGFAHHDMTAGCVRSHPHTPTTLLGRPLVRFSPNVRSIVPCPIAPCLPLPAERAQCTWRPNGTGRCQANGLVPRARPVRSNSPVRSCPRTSPCRVSRAVLVPSRHPGKTIVDGSPVCS